MAIAIEATSLDAGYRSGARTVTVLSGLDLPAVSCRSSDLRAAASRRS
jgi:hypothetical protein